MFINYTNHPSANWGEKQTRQASEYGEIVDIHFPAISPEMSRDEIYELACRECERILCILEYEKDSAVLCQGEFSFTYLMVHFLQSKKIKVFTAVSERKVKELSEGDISCKEVEFCFQGFREYDDRRMRPKPDEELHPSVYKKEFNRKKKEETILITQLGLGGYQNTTYIDEKGNRIANTGYAFDAVVQKENPDKMLFIGTRNSKWDDVIKWYSQDLDEKEKEEGRELGILISEKKTDWKAAEAFLCKAGRFEKVKIAIIPNGSSEEQLNEYFNILFEAFNQILDKEKNTRIIFDISNGFRSIPLYMMMFIRYVGMISNKKISYTVYYGMFDARQGNATPLVNLNTVSELTEWINAISEFRSFGSVKKLYQCLEMEKNKDNADEVNGIITEIQHFDYALNSNNLYYLETGIKHIVNLDVDALQLSSQAKLMLEDLRKDFSDRFVDETAMYPHAKMLVKLSQLFTQQGRYGAAAVSVQESIITYIMERYVRTYIMDTENLNSDEYERYIQQYDKRRPVKEHFDRKVNAYMSARGKRKAVSDEMCRFMELYLNIKNDIRNVDAHIIAREKVPTSAKMEEWLNKSIAFMLKDMNTFIPQSQNNGFAVLYEDFRIEENSAEKQKYAIEFIRGTSHGKWNLINEGQPEISADFSQKLSAAGVKQETVQKLRQELLYVKNRSEKNLIFTTSDLKTIPLICKILNTWFETDKQRKPQSGEVLQYLQTKRDMKGKKKTAYERLESVMKNNLLQKVLNILTE